MKEAPFLKMIGWDLMLARKGFTYFEGNYAQMHGHRFSEGGFFLGGAQ
jgi:hypothetical protein